MLGLFTELRGHQLLEVGWTKFTASGCRAKNYQPIRWVSSLIHRPLLWWWPYLYRLGIATTTSVGVSTTKRSEP